MTNKPMLSVEPDVIESALECLERCQEQAFQSCECEMCLECGKMPDGCSGTECAKTCQCSTCEHCCNEQAIKELRTLLAKPAEPSRFVGAAQYWSENEQALRDVCKFEGLKGLVYQVVRDRDRPAAQHRGEPVVYTQFLTDVMTAAGLVSHGKQDKKFAERLADECARLQVGQPAPVAVMPEQLIAAIEAEQERLSQEDYLMDSDECIQVIREEVARLNTK